ncbi:hypothetical protein BMT54_02520 [Pasteurellaceae bacterium 15-036681]|nr:hypothetical protein BMT54_02520 [Pasteurellaceae bacterium 15-036681]
MNKIPQAIVEFIQANHVVSLACTHNGEHWIASCFYAFDLANQRLIILTKSTTQHGNLMSKNPQVVGTIAGQPTDIREIEGIQFRATATQLVNSEQKQTACDFYCEKHPMGKFIPSDVWEIRLDYIKHTDNKLMFAQKIEWHHI